ncbi:MAG: hypothetical protein KA886_03645 [Candidatus Cloacimonetes bacterium]|nr:hypothetical protein [Candidatus Cloacimonadota bacterium]
MNMNLLKLVPVVSTFLSNWMKSKEHDNRIKHHDKTEEKIDVIENLIVRLERKLKDTRTELDELQRQILINRTINLILSIIIMIGMILIYTRMI